MVSFSEVCVKCINIIFNVYFKDLNLTCIQSVFSLVEQYFELQLIDGYLLQNSILQSSAIKGQREAGGFELRRHQQFIDNQLLLAASN